MKRKEKLIGLLAILAILVCATFAATKLNPENQKSETEEDTGITVYALDMATLANISWTQNGELISLDYTDDAWSYSSDGEFPLDSSYAKRMVESLADLTASKTIEAPDDESQYGLENPACMVLVTLDDGTYTQLSIGDETSMGGERYLSTGDGNVYLVDSSVLETFSYGLYDLVQMESIPSMTDVTSFEVISDLQSYHIIYQRDSGLAYSDQYTWFMEDGNGYLTLDNELTESLIEIITAMEWSQCVDYSADDGELATYGLDTPTAIVTVNCEDDVSFVLELGDYSDDLCYARIAGSDMVYLIDASICDTVLYTTYADLQPDEVLLMDWDVIDGFDVILDGVTYAIERDVKTTTDGDGNTTEEFIYTLDSEEIEIATVLDNISAMVSTGYSNGILPEHSEEIRFVFYRNADTFQEVELTFWQYDSASCLVTLNGDSKVFVAMDDVVSIVEAVNAMVF